MVPALLAIFAGGAAGSVGMAWAEQNRWFWAAAFVNLVLALHEASFLLLAAQEWVRTDLVMTVPLFLVVNVPFAAIGIWRRLDWAPILLALSAMALPAWLLLFRVR